MRPYFPFDSAYLNQLGVGSVYKTSGTTKTTIRGYNNNSDMSRFP